MDLPGIMFYIVYGLTWYNILYCLSDLPGVIFYIVYGLTWYNVPCCLWTYFV